MKKAIILVALLAWLAVPFICRSGFQRLFGELRESSLLLYRTCQSAGVDMDNDPWRACLKRTDVRLAFRMRDRFILPVGLAWIAIGAGLVIGFKETWRSSNKASQAIGAPGAPQPER
jgi:hypothetical protein